MCRENFSESFVVCFVHFSVRVIFFNCLLNLTKQSSIFLKIILRLSVVIAIPREAL